jgi:dihydroneopterin aldolase
MMTVSIRELTFECIIGILDFERLTPQRVIVDATLTYTYASNDFLDYAAVAEHIKAEMKRRRFELIEEALVSLGQTIKSAFPAVSSLEISITKPDILPDCRVSVAKRVTWAPPETTCGSQRAFEA